MNAISLFSSAGIGEMQLEEIGINVVLANELIEKRAETYKFFYPETDMICGDITCPAIKEILIKKAKESDVKLLIATPPCQGMSLAGKNRNQDDMKKDKRNYLIFDVLDIIDELDLDYILIENVPRFLNVYYPYGDGWYTIKDILMDKYKNRYNIKAELINSADVGVPQTRNRSIIKLYKKGLKWAEHDKVDAYVTVRDAIGDLPSLEAGEHSDIKNHSSRTHPITHIEWMKHTPTGKSAFDNKEYYPIKSDGTKIKGYKTCYKRMKWDEPAPTITMRNEIISSQNNVHPGRENKDGTWSDARVLTMRELLILSSIDGNLEKPPFLSETGFRHLIGEGVPPLMMKQIISKIGKSDETNNE